MKYPVPPGGTHIVVHPLGSSGHWLGWCDASVKKGGYAGGLVLQSPGLDLHTQSQAFPQQGRDSTHAELLAISALLEWAKPLTASLLVLTDSFQALEHLEKARGGRLNEKYPVLMEIIASMAWFSGLELQNVAREKNKLADSLASDAFWRCPLSTKPLAYR